MVIIIPLDQSSFFIQQRIKSKQGSTEILPQTVNNRGDKNKTHLGRLQSLHVCQSVLAQAPTADFLERDAVSPSAVQRK